MNHDQYCKRIREALVGEMYGEGLASELAAAAQSRDEHDKWAAVLQLESETKVRLRPFAAKLGISVLEDEEERRKGIEAARAFQDVPRDERLKSIRDLVASAVEWYERLVEAGPDADKPILRHLAGHERAILAFLDEELKGNTESSLTPVIDMLDHPLPRLQTA